MPKPETTNAKTIIFCLATLLGLFFAYQLRVLIINLLLALTLASAICPLAEKLEAKRISRIVTVLGVYATVALLYAAVAAFLAPAIWEQAVQLYQQLPAYMANFLEWYRQLVALAGENAQAVNFDIGDVRAVVIKLVHQTLDVTAGLVGVMLNGILVLFLTAYFVVEANIIWPELLKWVPPNKREHVSQLIRPLSSRMGGYVRGQILVSLAVASFLAVGLTLLGVKYSLVLGVLAGLLNLMPFVGSMLTA
ncbi:MAG: AI-2E family transporter, partial [Candidatus Melainabacteria bacterium]|nr:AI-2E family transporter [Candidatus Melainabacteria bacterium]